MLAEGLGKFSGLRVSWGGGNNMLLIFIPKSNVIVWHIGNTPGVFYGVHK